MKEKRFVECFGFFQIRSLYINMKYYKNIACIYFENVNIALNLYAYEENHSFMLEFIQTVYFSLLFVSWNPRHLFKIRSRSYSHISYNIIILLFHETIFFLVPTLSRQCKALPEEQRFIKLDNCILAAKSGTKANSWKMFHIS